MPKLEKSVLGPAIRAGSILTLTWCWRALLVASLLGAYAMGSRSGSEAPERKAIDPPTACLLRVAVDDGMMCRLETVLAQDDACLTLGSR